jgi:hypothetical protein
MCRNELLEISGIPIQPMDKEKLKWIQECHYSLVSGHPGRTKTYDLLSRIHLWGQMRKDVDHYIRNCHACQRSQATHRKTHGLLRPLEVSDELWKNLSMDFVIRLPEMRSL